MYYVTTSESELPPTHSIMSVTMTLAVIVLTQGFSPIDLLVSRQSRPGCKTSAQENPGEAVGGRVEKEENRVVEMYIQ